MIPATPRWTRLQRASEDVIKLAGADPGQRPWLLENLAGMLDALSYRYQHDGEQLKKSELRKELQEFCQKAKAIDRALRRPSVLEFINSESNDGLADIGPVIFGLRRYANAAKKAAEKIPSTAGATRAKVADNLLDARPWCALIVRELWLICQDRYPGDTHQHALKAAGKAWEGALGKKPKIQIDSWAPHFTKARKCHDWQVDFMKMTLNLKPLDVAGVYSESA